MILHLISECWRGTKDEGEKGEWKAGLKFIIQKIKIMASGPFSSREIEGKNVVTVTSFIFLVSKTLCMVTGAMK